MWTNTLLSSLKLSDIAKAQNTYIEIQAAIFLIKEI